MQPRYTNLSSIEPHPDYPLKMYYADEVDPRIAELEKALREAMSYIEEVDGHNYHDDNQMIEKIKSALGKEVLRG